MSVDKNKAFRDSWKVDLSTQETDQNTNTSKKTTSSEDENIGQQEQSLPASKGSKNVKKMRSDMKTDSKAKDGKEVKSAVTKTQTVSPKGVEGKTVSGNGSKGGNTTGGKGTVGGKGGVGNGGKGGNTGGGPGGHGGGPGGSGGGHGGGPGGGGHGGR